MCAFLGSTMTNTHGVVLDGEREGVLDCQLKREKLIIDTDPGIGEFFRFISLVFAVLCVPIPASILCLVAEKVWEKGKRIVGSLGLTTIFGNVTTEDATRNALLLCEIAGHPSLPVAEGSPEPLKGGRPRVADFIHGSDGLGNIFLPPPERKQIEKSASEFLVDMVSKYPGEVSILALGPLTNLALAIKRDSSFAKKVKRVVVLGGAFFALGNVNPAAEANIYGDPEAADVVFTSGANITVVGINITTQLQFTGGIPGSISVSDDDLLQLRQSKGKHAQLISDTCKFYRDWHVKSDGVHGIFLHDPVSFVALVRPELFTYKKGFWNSSNPWTGYSPVEVAWTVKVDEVLDYIRSRLMKS
ncbi:uridine-ribohydrolase 1 [Prunus dulcis]|uniref:Uridine-ribohydrolase 1 n=1 Tax=Prunus dulcis TaxID=3755 RepID=A0A4Y1RTH4_PRUDU|nr:uridine-ribohydrolase 1 [Prunus dulcis]